jgi:hypothetical protein
MSGYETDEDFLGYVEFHSRTERHAFSHEHANRLLDLAGETEIRGTDNCGLHGFIGIDWGAAKPLVEKARKRLKAAMI